MNSKIKKYYILAMFALVFIISSGFVHAADDFVDITMDPPGSFGPGFIINETNILPGDSFSRKMIISNKTADSRLVMLQFSSPASYSIFNNGLESEMLIEIKKSNGDPVAFPFSSGTTLENLYDETAASNFDILGPSSSQSYEIIFTFNPLATDQTKNSAKFDVALGVESDVYNPPTTLTTNDDGGGNGGNNNNGGGGGGAGAALEPAGSIGGGIIIPGIIETPVETESVQEKPPLFDVFSEPVQQCQGWPQWIWILALVVFTLNFWRNDRKNYRSGEYGWKVALVWTAAGAAFWYYFDFCREYRWFLYGAIIIAIVSHLIYAYYLREKVNKFPATKN